jgi:RimJ/RimL family protein N-acetyltransferase
MLDTSRSDWWLLVVDVIETDVANLVLRRLSTEQVATLVHLAHENFKHLTAFGDYREMFPLRRDSIADEVGRDDGVERFGLWLGRSLIGRFDLVPRDPGNLILGYWLDRAHTRHGYATAACTALIGYARTTLGATDVWAGVTKGNTPSERLLDRVGLRPVADMGTYTRFHIALCERLAQDVAPTSDGSPD